MKTQIARVPVEYQKEVEDMINKINTSFGIKISRMNASKLIILKSKNTNYILTERKLLEILGGA